ncbi:WD40 repeat domain-containing serine/threonine protein kinase [Streptomyces sp. NPDC002913]
MVESLRPGDPRRIGPYPLEGRLGAGGMGQVYLGMSLAGRKVAVKVIRPDLAAAPHFRERFALEVDAARRVGGFHTAQVVDADPHAESPWLATEFIQGRTLQQAVDEHGPMAEDIVLRLGAGLSEGLAAIHTCGLVHRDLKPGNVILAGDGPRIIDFGVAHAFEAGPMTRTGAIIGTYAYMSPEQIRSGPVSPASDVFALGSVLAFAATGQGPFDASTVPAIIHRVVSEPPRLTGLVEGGPLHQLLDLCLAKNPAERPSAAHILHRLSVTGPPGTPLPVRPFGRRSVLVGAAAATAAVAVPAYLLWPDSTPKNAPKNRTRKRPAPEGDPTKPVAQLKDHVQNIDCLAFSPDGKTLAGGGLAGTAWLWDVTTGRTVASFKGHSSSLLSVVYSPDGRTLYTGGLDQTLRSWDLRTRAPKGVLAKYTGAYESVNSLAVSPDGKTLAAGVNSGGLKLVSASTGRSTARFEQHTGIAHGVEFSPDGKALASVTERGRSDPVELWSTDTGRLIRTFVDDPEKRYRSVMFGPDGKSLAAAGDDVPTWDLGTGRLTAAITGTHDWVFAAAFRPGKRERTTILVAGGGLDAAEPTDPTGKEIQLWDVSTERVVTTLSGTTSKSHPLLAVSALAFSPDGKTLAVALIGASTNDFPEHAVKMWQLP